MMRAAVLRNINRSADGLSGPSSIPARMAGPAERRGTDVPTCIISQSSGCLFLPLFALAKAQALGTPLTAGNRSAILTFRNYNNSNQLSGTSADAPQLACGLRHGP
jgi:hypothetical protein